MLSDVKIPKLSADDIFANGMDLLFYTIGIMAVITIIIAGLSYVNSNGEPDRAAKAKNAIVYSLVGLLFVVFAFGITKFIIGRF